MSGLIQGEGQRDFEGLAVDLALLQALVTLKDGESLAIHRDLAQLFESAPALWTRSFH